MKKYLLATAAMAITLPAFVHAQGADSLEELSEISFEDLGDIITSVSKKPEPAFEASAAIYVISQSDIEQSGATSIPEILRMVPGLQVSQVDSSNWAITSRGFNDGFGNKLLVLIDGRSVYTPLFSGVYWDTQDTLLQDIERIEVIRGPGATLWGANAVNGVINIITKEAKDTQGVLVSAGYGNEERGFIEGRYGGNVDEKTFYRSYAKFFNRDESVLLGDNGGGGNDWHMTRGGFRIDHEQSSKSNFTFQGDIYDGNIDLDLVLPTLDAPFNEFIADTLDVSGGNLLGRWNYQQSEAVNHSLQVYYDYTQRNYTVFNASINTFDIDYQSTWNASDRNEIIWGTGYRLVWDDLDGTNLLDYDPGKRTTHLFNAFVQDKYAIVPEKLYLTVGSKFEHNDFTGFEIQPTIRGTWTPTNDQTVWAAVSRAVRTPNRSEDDISFVVLNLEPGFIRTFGSRDVVSETLIAYELGYRIKATPNLLFDATVFFNDYDDLRTQEANFDLTAPPDPAFALVGDNGATAESYGLEVSSTWDVLDNWQLKAAYSYLDLAISLKDGHADGVIERDEGKSPEHQFNIRSQLYLPHNVELSNSLYYVDKLETIGVPSYIRFDTRIAWKPITGLELSLVGQNLFDGEHSEFSGPFQGAANEIERSIFARVTWRY